FLSAVQDGPLSRGMGLLLVAILMTAQRPGDLRQMEWQHLNLATEDPVWTIPASVYKTHIAHSVPLAPQVVRLLSWLPRDGAFVFSGTEPFHPGSISNATRKVAAEAGMAPFTAHDLRRTARTVLSRAGAARDSSERLLGHKVGTLV